MAMNKIIITLLVLLCVNLSVSYADTVKPVTNNQNRDIPLFECLIQPDMVVNITSPSIGIIDKISVDVSDTVKRGDALAYLESDVQKASVAVTKARADRLDEVQLRQTNLDFARRKLARISELHSKRSISPQEKDEAETAVNLAEIELEKAKNENQLAILEYEKSVQMLDKRTIRSPIDGIVVNKLVSPGELAEEKPIFTIAKVDPLRVELIVPVDYFGMIKPGMKTHVMPELTSTTEYIATVAVVDKVIDAPSGTFRVRLTLPNPHHKLPGGLKCQAKFIQ